MFKIVMFVNGMRIEMPNEANLGLVEATLRADFYAKRNKNASFSVINKSNGDVEYESK